MSGPLVDAFFEDVLLDQGGLLVVVELQTGQESGAYELLEGAARPSSGMYARLLLVTFAHGFDDGPTVWPL